MNMLTLTADRPLLLLGCGNMGHALLKGWLQKGVDQSALQVVEPAGRVDLPAEQAHSAVPDGLAPRVVVIAVKPQIISQALSPLGPRLMPDTLVISIAAGVSLATLSGLLGGHDRLVRAMPNTPAAIGAGITAAVVAKGVAEADRALAEQLLSAVGVTRFIADEKQMDAVTALSGSGPAYVFHLLECLTAGGVSEGLPEVMAAELALETVLGAALLAKQSRQSPAVLRAQVTSPNGTTQAGLDVLMAPNGLAPLIRHTLSAAAHRSRELGQQSRKQDEGK
jgi:pyrroline-5-carboxylate reductase